ncbi:MAG: hypothetical protein ACP5TL_01620 [Candidatus Micrarchaeia archaeon]
MEFLGSTKGQAALIEALIGTLLMVIFATSITRIAYQDLINRNTLNYINAVNDFIFVFYENPALSRCVINANASCIMPILEKFASTYDLNYISIEGSTNAHYGNLSQCSKYYDKCFVSGENFSILCIEDCGN